MRLHALALVDASNIDRFARIELGGSLSGAENRNPRLFRTTLIVRRHRITFSKGTEAKRL